MWNFAIGVVCWVNFNGATVPLFHSAWYIDKRDRNMPQKRREGLDRQLKAQKIRLGAFKAFQGYKMCSGSLLGHVAWPGWRFQWWGDEGSLRCQTSGRVWHGSNGCQAIACSNNLNSYSWFWDSLGRYHRCKEAAFKSGRNSVISRCRCLRVVEPSTYKII